MRMWPLSTAGNVLVSGLRPRRIRKWLLITLLLIGGCVVALIKSNRRPDDDELIHKFRSNKSAYARLRDMLLEDDQILRVADWGVELSNSTFPLAMPPVGGFSLERYKQYMQLLAETDNSLAFRSRGPNPILCILVWSDGFAGNRRHASVCWLAAGTQSSGSEVKERGQ